MKIAYTRALYIPKMAMYVCDLTLCVLIWLQQDQNLDGWMIKRKVDNAAEMNFNFPKGFVLKSGRSVKVRLTFF